MAEADDRPRWARNVRVGVMLELIGLAALWWWQWHKEIEPTTWQLWFPALCVVTAVGVWRRVAWGRFLHGVVSVLLALAATCNLTPILDDAYPSGRDLVHGLEHVPLAPWWALIVVAATLPLIPAVALSWRRRWFRSALW